MPTFDAAQAAARIAAAWTTGQCFVAAEHPAPPDVAAVYAVHRALLPAIAPGQRVDTWKISPRKPDAPPLAAPIPRRLASPATLRGAPGRLLGIEAEIAYRFDRDLAPRPQPYVDAEVRAAVGTAHVAVEVCATRFTDWSDAPALWKLADLQSTACLVVSEGQSNWRALDPVELEAVVVDGDVERMRRRNAHPNGDPASLLVDLVAHACAEGDGVRAGDIVTTGSWIGLLEVELPARVEVRFDGVGVVRLELEAKR